MLGASRTSCEYALALSAKPACNERAVYHGDDQEDNLHSEGGTHLLHKQAWVTQTHGQVLQKDANHWPESCETEIDRSLSGARFSALPVLINAFFAQPSIVVHRVAGSHRQDRDSKGFRIARWHKQAIALIHKCFRAAGASCDDRTTETKASIKTMPKVSTKLAETATCPR